MRVVAKCRRGISVTEALLRAKQLTPADQEGRYGVPQTVEADTGKPSLVAELGEPVPQSARGLGPAEPDS